MIYKKEEFPETGEVVIATVKQVFDYGAYVTLDEYQNKQAFLPWSEISSKWVKNIRDVIRENMKIPVKVIRVDKKKGNIDVSLKKVTDDEKRKKMLQWKRLQKIDKLIEIVAQKIGKKEKEVWENVIWKLEEKYGDAYTALEKAVKDGAKILIESGVGGEYIKPLLEEVSKHVEEKKFKSSALISLRSYDPEGVNKLKEVFEKSLSTIPKDNREIRVRVYTIGAPRYRIDVIGNDQKEVNSALQLILNNLKLLAQENRMEFLIISGSKK
jgi:translation initiation factor 2 subunit 1